MNATGKKARTLAVFVAVALGFQTANLFVRAGTVYYWYSIGPQPINTQLGFNNDTLSYNYATYGG